MNLVTLQSRMESIKAGSWNTTNVKKSMYDCLDLPWNENYWKIKVTHAVAPNEVWAVLTENAVKKNFIFKKTKKKRSKTTMRMHLVNN